MWLCADMKVVVLIRGHVCVLIRGVIECRYGV